MVTRLLKYAESAIMRKPLVVWRDINEGSCTDEEEKEILSSLKQAFDVSWHEIYHLLTDTYLLMCSY